MDRDKFHEARFDLDAFLASADGLTRAAMQQQPAVAEFLRRALDTCRKTRLKPDEFFRLFWPGRRMPAVNLGAMQLRPATREFLCGQVRQRTSGMSFALADEFCAFLGDASGEAKLVTEDYNGLVLLLGAAALPL